MRRVPLGTSKAFSSLVRVTCEEKAAKSATRNMGEVRHKLPKRVRGIGEDLQNAGASRAQTADTSVTPR